MFLREQDQKQNNKEDEKDPSYNKLKKNTILNKKLNAVDESIEIVYIIIFLG